jgi:hypothetical protein
MTMDGATGMTIDGERTGRVMDGVTGMTGCAIAGISGT